MNHPVIMQDNARVRYDEILEAAETHRRIKRLRCHDLASCGRVWSLLNDTIIDILGWLKLRRRSDVQAAKLNH
jgi:hypothetical protein